MILKVRKIKFKTSFAKVLKALQNVGDLALMTHNLNVIQDKPTVGALVSW